MENQPISKENLVLVDWLTFTTKIWSESDLLSMLHISSDVSWEHLDAYRYGYRHRMTFGGMSILSDGQENMGICIEFSGTGCRSFESFSDLSWFAVFGILLEPANEFKITRLDLAYDDHTGVLDIGQILDDTDDRYYRSKTRWWNVDYGSTGTTIYHGSPQSKIRLRIYDKAAERGLTDGTHWIRVEIALRDENASGAAAACLDQKNVGAAFGGILRNYVVYCSPTSDSNRSRWPVAEYWEALLHDAAAIQIAARSGTEYNIWRLKSYLFDQAGGAIYTWVQLYGIEGIEELLKERKSPLNPNHKNILRQAGKLEESNGNN